MDSRILVGRKSFLVLIFFSGDEMVFFSPLDVEKGFSRDYFKVRLRLTMKKTLEKPFSTSRGEKNAISTPEKKNCDQKNFSVHLNSTNHHENSYFNGMRHVFLSEIVQITGHVFVFEKRALIGIVYSTTL